MQFRSGEILHGLDDRNNPASLQSVRFEKCAFLNSVASFNRQNDRRSRFKDIHLKDCEIQDCYIGPAIFEDCTVENLKNSGDLLVVWGAVFRRVKLSGNIGRFKTNSAFGPDGVMKPSLNEPFDEFRDHFTERPIGLWI